MDEPGSSDVVEEALAEVCDIAVYDTTVTVSAAGALVEELRIGLANLAAENDARPQLSGVAATHQLGVHLHGDTWIVRWDGEGRYRGPEASMALYDALIALNHHASRRATQLGHTVLHGGA